MPKISWSHPSHVSSPYPKRAAAAPHERHDADLVDTHAPLTDAQKQARQGLALLRPLGLKAVQDLQAAERAGLEDARYVTPSNNAGSASVPTVGDPHGHHASADPNHWTAGVGTEMLATGNRGGAALGTTQQVDGSTLTVSGFQDVTAMGGAVGGNLWSEGQSKVTLQGMGLSNGDVHGAGLSLGWVGAAGERVGATALAMVTAGSSLKTGQYYSGDNPRLQGKQLAQWEEFAAPVVHINASGGAHTFGVGGMLELSRKRTATYHKWVDPETLQQMHAQREGKLQPVRSVMQGLNLARKEIEVPALKRLVSGDAPVALEEGEQISLRVKNSGKMGVSGGMYGVRAGLYYSQSGERELTVRRISDSEVEVASTPRTARTVSANLDLAVAAEAYVSVSSAESEAQSFAFDVHTQSGREGLSKMLHGELPIGGESVQRARIDEGGAVTLAGKVRGDVLAPGIRRTLIEKSRRVESRAGGGVPRPFMTKNLAGLSRHGSSFEEDQVMTPGDGARLTKTYGHTVETQKLTLGTVKSQAQGSVRKTAVFDENTNPVLNTDGVIAQTEFSQERVRGKARDHAAREMGAAFGREVAPFKHAADFDNLTIASKVVLTDSHVNQLRDKSSLEIHDAANQAGAAGHKLETALSLGHHGLARYLGAEGVRAQGAVARLLGPGGEQFVKVTTTSSAYHRPLEKWENFPRAKLEDALAGSRKHRKVLAKLARLNRRLEHGVRHTNDDAVIRAFDEPEFVKRLTTIGNAYQQSGALLRTQQQRLDEVRRPGEKK